MGLRLDWLGTEALSWRDLRIIIKFAPRGSAISRSVLKDGDEWGTSEHLLASIFDATVMANWQRGDGKGRRPEPIPRPGVRPSTETLAKGKPMTIEEANARLGWKKGGR